MAFILLFWTKHSLSVYNPSKTFSLYQPENTFPTEGSLRAECASLLCFLTGQSRSARLKISEDWWKALNNRFREIVSLVTVEQGIWRHIICHHLFVTKAEAYEVFGSYLELIFPFLISREQGAKIIIIISSNWTGWSTIQGVIMQEVWNYEHYCSLNCTAQGSIAN